VLAAVVQNPVISPVAFSSGNTTAVFYSTKNNVERKKNKGIFLHISL
jgi:hypothetical protein